MNPETRICKNCKSQFVVEPEDFRFYEKMQVPPPKMCPRCRRQHLLLWRNQRTLYNRTCGATKKPIVSIFAPESPYVVYDRDYWWSDAWDPVSYGQDIDFSKTFAEQFDALLRRVPLPAVINGKSENSQYTNHVGLTRNCYLTFASWEAENVYYSDMAIKSKDSLDLLEVSTIENSYELVGCTNSYNLKYSFDAENCTDSWFLYDCKNCINCIGCVNLRNKKYHIFNKPYAKDDYEKMACELRLDTRDGIEDARRRFLALVGRGLHRYANLINAQDSTGDNLLNTKNCRFCFAIRDAEDCAYCLNGASNMKDVYEGYGVGAVLERGYYVFDTGDQSTELICTGTVWGSQYVYYSYQCFASFELFGCIGLRSKKYHIFNKPYAKEEYLKLKEKLIAHMRETGEWGEFFSPRIAPFGYNETLAQEYVPLGREATVHHGFRWQDRVPGTYGKETLQPENIPETLAETPDTILQEILACIDCKKNYKIVPHELAFYRKHALPIPAYCPDCRYHARRALRRPHELWHRTCGCAGAQSGNGIYKNTAAHFHAENPCPNEFETPYAPNRKEIVYCEQCYKTEVI